MKMFDKIKDLFTDEVEVETPVKKEVIQVEIPAPKVVEKKEEAPKEAPKVESRSVFFDEKDFDDMEKSTPEPKIETYRTPYSGDIKKDPYKDPTRIETKREPYGVKKEKAPEKKHFEPTPIISPVYGVLDRNYKKDDIVDKPKVEIKTNKDITIDDVRNKAYGTLEDELESTLFGKTSILFANKDDKDDYKDIESELKDTANALDLLTDDVPKHSKKEIKISNTEIEVKESTPEEVVKEDIDTPDDNMINDVLNDDYNSDEKLSESDLFNLIDDMYEKGDKK